MYNNTEYSDIVSIGFNSMRDGGGDRNIAIGTDSAYSLFGTDNVAIGHQSLYTMYNGKGNVAIGAAALFTAYDDTEDAGSVAIGFNALFSQTSGNKNVAIGYKAGESIQQGSANVIIGHASARTLNGGNNVIIGGLSNYPDDDTMYTFASENVIIGVDAAQAVTDGVYNTIIGTFQGLGLEGGDENIFIGGRNPGGAFNGFDVAPNMFNSIIIGGNQGRIAQNQDQNIVVLGNDGSEEYFWNDLNDAWGAISDVRDKTNTGSIDYGLDLIRDLPIKQYNWNRRNLYSSSIDNDGRFINQKVIWGTIAQDVLTIAEKYPVITGSFFYSSGSYKDGSRFDRIIFKPGIFLWPAIQAIKDLDQITVKLDDPQQSILANQIQIYNTSSEFAFQISGSSGDVLTVFSDTGSVVISGSINISGSIISSDLTTSPSSTSYFYDAQQYDIQDYRHIYYYLSSEVSSSNANSWRNTILNNTNQIYLPINTDSSYYVRVKWIGRTNESGGNNISITREDYFYLQKDGNVVTGIQNINMLRSNDNIGFDTNYAIANISGTDNLVMQYRIGNYNGIIYDLSSRDFTFRTKAVVELLSVNFEAM